VVTPDIVDFLVLVDTPDSVVLRDTPGTVGSQVLLVIRGIPDLE